MVDEKRICTFATPKRSAERKRGKSLGRIFEKIDKFEGGIGEMHSALDEDRWRRSNKDVH